MGSGLLWDKTQSNTIEGAGDAGRRFGPTSADVERERAAAPITFGIRSRRRVASRDPDGYRSSVVGRQAGAESFPRLPIPTSIGIELCLVSGRDRTLRQSLKSLLAPAVPPIGGFLSAT